MRFEEKMQFDGDSVKPIFIGGMRPVGNIAQNAKVWFLVYQSPVSRLKINYL